jgi:hypothetical protein
MTYSLFLLLALLTPSLYWDHYAVLALLPLLACYARVPVAARPGAFLLMLSLAFPLGGFLNLRGWAIGVMLAVAIVALALLVLRFRGAGLRAGLWAIAAALLIARFPFDLPAFRGGAGLPATSVRLWGTLILFALCLVERRREGAERRHSEAVDTSVRGDYHPPHND